MVKRTQTMNPKGINRTGAIEGAAVSIGAGAGSTTVAEGVSAVEGALGTEVDVEAGEVSEVEAAGAVEVALGTEAAGVGMASIEAAVAVTEGAEAVNGGAEVTVTLGVVTGVDSTKVDTTTEKALMEETIILKIRK